MIDLRGFPSVLQGQIDDKGRALSYLAMHLDSAQVALQDFVADGQTQTRSLAHRLGGKKGIENAGKHVLRYSLARIRNFDEKMPVISPGSHTALVVGRVIARDRLGRVDQKIDRKASCRE